MRLTPWQKGLVFALLVPLFYALKSAGVKFAPHAKVEFFVFFRFVFDFLLLTPFFIRYYKRLRPRQLPLHGLRAIFVVLSIGCSVYGVRHLALVDAILLENTLPLFIPLVAWVWHRKKIPLFSFFTLGLGFLAVFLLLKPQLDILRLASFVAIGAGFCAAITTVSIGTLSKTEHPIAILFYFNLLAGSVTCIPCIYTWESNPAMTSISFWLPFVFISLCGILFQYALIKAHSVIPSHVAGNFGYFDVLFGAALGWLIWGETLSGMQILGGCLLIGSGLLILHRNQRDTEKPPTVSKEESIS